MAQDDKSSQTKAIRSQLVFMPASSHDVGHAADGTMWPHARMTVFGAAPAREGDQCQQGMNMGLPLRNALKCFCHIITFS